MSKSNEKQLNKKGNRRGMSPNSRKNLDKGRKGNKHAEKDYSITRILKDMANEVAEERFLEIEDKGKGFTRRQAVAKRIWLEAMRGNTKVTGELLDRIDGKIIQPAGLEGTITLRVIYDDSDRIQNPSAQPSQ